MVKRSELGRAPQEPIQAAAIHRLRRLGKSDDDEDILNLVIASFHEDARRWRIALPAALAERDFAALRHIGHTLRGSASVLGAERLIHICGALEAAAERQDAQGCARQLGPLEIALSDVQTALARLDSPGSLT